MRNELIDRVYEAALLPESWENLAADLAVHLDGRESCLILIGGEIAATRTEARQDIAASIAMSSAPMPSTAGKTSWVMNVGYFKGETALGGSLTHRFDTAIPLGLTLGYSYGGSNSHAARLGLMGEF